MRLPREPLLPTTNKAQRGGGCSVSFVFRVLLLVGGGVGLLYAGFAGRAGGVAKEAGNLKASPSHVSSGVVGVEMVQREKLLQAEVQQDKEKKVQPTLDFAQANTADVAAQSITKPGSDGTQPSKASPVSKPGENNAEQVPNVTIVDPKDPIAVGAQQAETEIKAPQTKPAVGRPDAVVQAPAPAATGLYAMSAKNILGETVPLSTYAGNVSIVVNVASYCGFTDTNYKGLEELYQQYKSKGFVVLAFPCNQFGAQEPGSNQDIESFAASHYNVTFPLFAKTEVNGPNTDPVYKFLKKHLPDSEGGAGNVDIDLQWNFQKFLVDRNGFPQKLFYQQFDRHSLEGPLKELLDAPRKETPS